MASRGTRTTRSRKTSISKKPASPSLTSLFSGITNISASSSGSNSTVTQESASRPKPNSPKPTASDRTQPAVLRYKEGPTKGDSARRASEERPDVFAFIEESPIEQDDDEEEEEEEPMEELSHKRLSQVSDSSSYMGSSPVELPTSPFRSDNHRRWSGEGFPAGSLHSDSGISVRSSSPEVSSPILNVKYPSPRNYGKPEGTMEQLSNHSVIGPDGIADLNKGSKVKSQRDAFSNDRDIDTIPENYYSTASTPLSNHRSPTSTRSRHSSLQSSTHSAASHSAKKGPKRKSTRKGYDLVAANISTTDDEILKPIYRKFETLNNRILLYQQDEISELEEDLRKLDVAIAQEQKALGSGKASRRAEAKASSQLQWHRAQLIGGLSLKLDTYHRSLSSYNSLTKGIESASKLHVQQYQSWIAENDPLVHPEVAFIHNEADLVAVTRANLSSVDETPKSGDFLRAMGFILVCTVITFKLIPFFFTRLVVGGVLGLAMAFTLLPSPFTRPMELLAYRRNISVYAAVMVVLAIAVG